MNRIRECPLYPNLLVTHTDAPELYVWNIRHYLNPSHINGKTTDAKGKGPELILVGHEKDAEYALGMSNDEPKVASGGQDHKANILGTNEQFHWNVGIDLEPQ